MDFNKRHYSALSALLVAVVLSFSLFAHVYAFSPLVDQLSNNSAKTSQADKSEGDHQGNQGSNGNGGEKNDNGHQNDNQGNKNDNKATNNENHPHGKIKLKAEHDDNGGSNVQLKEEDQNENDSNQDVGKLASPSDNGQSETFPADFNLTAAGGIALERGPHNGNSNFDFGAATREGVSLSLNASTIRLEGNHVRVAVDGFIMAGDTKFEISDGHGIIIFFNNPSNSFFRGIIHITGMAADSQGSTEKFHMRAVLIPTKDNSNSQSTWNFVVAPAAKLGPHIRIISLVGVLNEIGTEKPASPQPPTNQQFDHFDLSNISSTVEAGKLFNVTITAKDKDGNTVKNYFGNVRVSDKTGTVKPILLAGFTNGTFTASMNITKAMTSDMLTFQDVASGKNQTSNSFDVIAGTINSITLDPSSASIQPGKSANFTATLLDRFSNPISPSGKSFGWLLSSNASGSVATSLNKANFTALSTVALETNVTLTVRVNTTSNGSSFVQDQSKITISPTAQQSLNHFAIDTISSPKIAGTPFDLKVTAMNSANQTIINFAGTLVLNDTTGSLQSVTNNGFSGGIWTGSVKITKASANVTITASDHDFPGKMGSSNLFDVKEAALDHFKITGIGGSNQTAGQMFLFDVTAFDGFGNIVKDYNGTVTPSTNDGSSPAGNGTLLSPNPYTFAPSTDKGKHTFNATLYNAKANVTISVAGSGKDGTSSKFNVLHANVANVTISPPSISLAPGDNSTFTAQAKDAYGNIVDPSEAAFAWSLSSSSLGSLDHTSGEQVTFTATTSSLVELLGSISVSSGPVTASSNITVTAPP